MLSKIEIEEGLQILGSCAFNKCEALESISLPSSLRTIKDNAFASCIRLKNLELKEGIELIEMWALSECRSLEEIYIPKTTKELEPLSLGSNNLKRVIIPRHLRKQLKGALVADSKAFVEMY